MEHMISFCLFFCNAELPSAAACPQIQEGMAFGKDLVFLL
jgi:hypothetical protein